MTEPNQSDRESSGGNPDSTKRLKLILPSSSDGISLGEIVGDKHPEDVSKFRRETALLRRRLRATAKKTKQLSSDTAFLIKKTTGLPPPKKISCNDIGWEKKLSEIEIGPEGIFVVDVYGVEAIKFISAFAAKRQLLVDYAHGSFRLTPRDQ